MGLWKDFRLGGGIVRFVFRKLSGRMENASEEGETSS